MPAAVEAEGLECAFGARRALCGVSFRADRGQVIGLLGPNGSGKTTLFRIVATLLRPTAGTARVFGHDVVREAPAARRRFGVVFQNASLDRKLSAAENLRYQAAMYGLRGPDARRRIDELLSRARLGERAGDPVETYSGGMARRVEIAKGLLHRPELLLLDEPSAGLDPAARREVWGQLEELRALDGITILFTTHLMEEAERAERVLILDRGRLVADGSPERLRGEVGGDVVRIETGEPEAVRAEIEARFGGAARVVDGSVYVERQRGHEFVPAVMEALGGRIRAVSVGKPTLEDVFVHHTGHGLFEAGEARG